MEQLSNITIKFKQINTQDIMIRQVSKIQNVYMKKNPYQFNLNYDNHIHNIKNKMTLCENIYLGYGN